MIIDELRGNRRHGNRYPRRNRRHRQRRLTSSMSFLAPNPTTSDSQSSASRMTFSSERVCTPTSALRSARDEIEFAPYDANQLRDILAWRAAGALRDTEIGDEDEPWQTLESTVLTDDAIPLSPVRSPPRTPATLVRQSSCCSAPAGSPTTRANSRSLSSTSAMPTSTFEQQAAVERGIKSLPLQRALAF